MHKIIKILAIALGLIGVVLWLLLLGSVDPYTDFMFYIAYVLTFAAAGIAVIYSIGNLLTHPDKLKRALVSVGVLVVVAVVSFALASGDPLPGADASTSKWVGAGLYAFYILTVVAAGAMIFSGIKRLLTK
ncbi:hypothetical protein ACG2LH_05080 [Zhouia sp. PK063]|uniref:hypothetical protein n=1 Tax=Zhouia sp. PK063 TaxID=3373602 RepID=UPI0037ACB84F